MSAVTREGAATQAIGSGTVASPRSRTLHDLVRDLPEAELRGSADVLVSSVRPGGSSQGGEALPLEEVSFNAGKIEFTYTATDQKTGKAAGDVKMHWSVVENKGG